jgi:CMP-2-keto-3-deoxyoctulosonic acid synthetase
MKKKYRIIIDVTGDAPVVEAESVVEAEEKFAANVTAEQLLKLLKIGAAEMSEERAPGDAAAR